MSALKQTFHPGISSRFGQTVSSDITQSIAYDAPISEDSVAADSALAKMLSLGAAIVDDLELPSFDEFLVSYAENTVLNCEFKEDLTSYLIGRVGSSIHSLEDLIQYATCAERRNSSTS